MSNIEYIKNSSSVKPIFDVHGTRVYIKDKLPINISVEDLKREIHNKIPPISFLDIKNIFIGDFEYLSARNATAISYENSMFLTNSQESVNDVVSDIAHEVGHSLEKRYFYNIHKNPALKKEYIFKKQHALRVLKQRGYDTVNIDPYSSEHDPFMDKLITSEIGLHNIENIFANTIVTPYSLVSLSEYFCEGLEFYLLNDVFYLQSICPVLYNIIEEILGSEL